MSLKSERKKQIKTQKQSAAAVEAISRQMYADTVTSIQKDHLLHCQDAHCTGTFTERYPIKLVAVLMKNKPREIFLAPFGSEATPAITLNLADGAEIASLLEGKVDCTHCDNHIHESEPICLGFTCHNAGASLLYDMKDPHSIAIVCAERGCGNYLNYLGFEGKVRLAPEPKAEYPNVFCSVHGIQPAYIACDHVLSGETPLVLGHPTPENYGLALCTDDCYERLTSGKHSDEFHTACIKSLTEILGDRLTKGEVNVLPAASAA